MKKFQYLFLVVFSIISTTSVLASGKECTINDTRCMQKKLTVERKVVRILKDAAASAIERVDDSYMKNTLTTLYNSCSEKPEIDDNSAAGGVADKAFYELVEIETQSRCYQDVLSNSFIIDLSTEALAESMRNHL
ncbi:MAG: hypothetical protein HN337_06475 [Deltaproteobacteria bacterium]|jgi:hypothetical protein|nr:hypothetical protein [Deltaproteobacteria bacterium]